MPGWPAGISRPLMALGASWSGGASGEAAQGDGTARAGAPVSKWRGRAAQRGAWRRALLASSAGSGNEAALLCWSTGGAASTVRWDGLGSGEHPGTWSAWGRPGAGARACGVWGSGRVQAEQQEETRNEKEGEKERKKKKKGKKRRRKGERERKKRESGSRQDSRRRSGACDGFGGMGRTQNEENKEMRR